MNNALLASSRLGAAGCAQGSGTPDVRLHFARLAAAPQAHEDLHDSGELRRAPSLRSGQKPTEHKASIRLSGDAARDGLDLRTLPSVRSHRSMRRLPSIKV